jgi:signal transduction histidine kinase
MSIAHEANTPLSIGVMEIRLIKEALETQRYDYVKQLVEEQEQVLLQGLQDVKLLLSTASLDDKPKDWGKHSVVSAVKYALDTFYMTPEERKKVHFINALGDYDFTFDGSAELLRLVIFNLMKNALKYAGSNATIQIWAENRKLYFRDDGRGISPQVLSNLFKRYVTESKSGHGIGLNFCKEVMNKMNGEIECQSTLGKGTTFILSF